MLDRVYFAQGFDYAEGVVGTNGVGTVLEFGESMHVVGAEHFVESLQDFACAGAPVRDPFTGRIEGVLDLSCMSEHSTPLMHSLVRSAARQIEHNLLADRDQAQQALFDAYSRVETRSRQAVLAVGRRTVLGNSPLRDLLDARDQEVLQDHVRFVMSRHATVDDEVELPTTGTLVTYTVLNPDALHAQGGKSTCRGSVMLDGTSITVTGDLVLQASDAFPPFTSNHCRFFRPALICETTTFPRAPLSNSRRTDPASSVSMGTSSNSDGAPASFPLKVSTSALGFCRVA